MGRIAAVFVAALGMSVGCTTRVKLSEPSGLGLVGGGAGTGGTRGTPSGGGGNSADGGPFGPGTGGAGTACLGDTDGGGADAHPATDAGVCLMLPADPPVFPWVIQPRGAPGGVDAGVASGCQSNVVSGQLVDVVCSGAAWLRPSGGAGDAGTSVPSVTWDDGSMMSWSPVGLDKSIAPPIAAGTPEQRVWVALESHGWLSLPGQCGWFWNQSMELRDSAGGPIRFMARQGATLSELTGAESAALFGVATQPVESCTHDMYGGPALFHQTLYDHLVETTPGQRVLYAQPTTVKAPSGTFAVLWYSRTQRSQALSMTCAGCLAQGPIVGFVASRVP